MNKRILSFLLAIILMLSSFAGCANESGNNPQLPTGSSDTGTPTSDTPSSDVPSSDVPSSDVPSSDVPSSDVPSSDMPSSDVPSSGTPSSSNNQNQPADVPDPVIEHTINAENIGEYRIVCTTASGTQEQHNIGLAFLQELNEKFGTNEEPSTDLATSEYEIVVGKANRTELQSLLAPHHDTDGVVACVGNRIFITSETAEGLEKAIKLFWKTYYNSKTKTVFIRDGEKTVDSEFSLPKDLKINGVPLSKYTVVYPAKADRITVYTAFALADYFSYNADMKFHTSFPRPDSYAETEYEILIGATNRAQSQKLANTVFKNAEYTMYADGNKIICYGNGYYVGSAVHEFISNYFPDTGTTDPINVTDLPTTLNVKSFTFPKATSAIMMIGDGMGNNHIHMAIEAGIIDRFYGFDLPFQTWCKTYSVDGVTDSAASATALATGYKTRNGYIGKDAKLNNVLNVSEVAYAKGARVAVLTTDSLDGATPAGFNVHSNSRSNSEEILTQFEKKLNNGQLICAQGKLSDLTQPSRQALGMISKNNSKFFIMIEEAYTDKGSHSNDASTSNSAVRRLNDAIAYAIAFVMLHPDTALLITADHETGGLTANPNGGYYYTSTGHTGTDVPYFALGGENVAEFIATDTTLNNVWNAMFIASIFGMNNFGDPNLRYNK